MVFDCELVSQSYKRLFFFHPHSSIPISKWNIISIFKLDFHFHFLIGFSFQFLNIVPFFHPHSSIPISKWNIISIFKLEFHFHFLIGFSFQFLNIVPFFYYFSLPFANFYFRYFHFRYFRFHFLFRSQSTIGFLPIFFSLKNMNLAAHFLLLTFFDNINF